VPIAFFYLVHARTCAIGTRPPHTMAESGNIAGDPFHFGTGTDLRVLPVYHGRKLNGPQDRYLSA
jgi:hypothetical protein